MDLKLEKSLWRKGFDAVVGIDEVGRGSLVGPMVLGAVILFKEDFKKIKKIIGVKDSKQLSANKRKEIFGAVKELQIPHLLQDVSPNMIDTKNIYRAGLWGCNMLVNKCKKYYGDSLFVVFDGGLFATKHPKEQQKTYVKGDQRIFSVALASVIAKHSRDSFMTRLSKRYPEYDWDLNKGYGTRAHRVAILRYGLTPLHRVTFTSFEKK